MPSFSHIALNPWPPDENGGGEFRLPLTPAVSLQQSVVDRIKRSKSVMVVSDTAQADESGIEREIVLAPRNGETLNEQQVNALLLSLAPPGTELDALDVPTDGLEEESTLEDEEEADEDDDEELEESNTGCASFEVESSIGTARTTTTIDIPDEDTRELWQAYGGTPDASEDTVEDVVYAINVKLFPNAAEAERYLQQFKHEEE